MNEVSHEMRDTEDDRALVETARTDPGAFAPLYRRYAVPVYQYCYRRLGTREQAEDATSQIFLNAFSALSSHRDDRSFRSWLFSIAHNVVTDSYRARRSFWPTVIGSHLPDPTAGPEETALSTIEQDEIRSSLNRLPATQKRVLELRLAGLTHREIAEVLGKRSSAIKMLQFRAIETLRRTMPRTETTETVDDNASIGSKEGARVRP
jgi:RNA polymerase sigma-70 factor (ECF subfamily)